MYKYLETSAIIEFWYMTRRLFSRDCVTLPGVYLVESNVFATYEDFDLGKNYCV